MILAAGTVIVMRLMCRVLYTNIIKYSHTLSRWPYYSLAIYASCLFSFDHWTFNRITAPMLILILAIYVATNNMVSRFHLPRPCICSVILACLCKGARCVHSVAQQTENTFRMTCDLVKPLDQTKQPAREYLFWHP